MSKKKILFPTDFAEIGAKAQESAMFLAEKFNADLYIMHAIQPSKGIGKVFGGNSEDELRENAQKKMGILNKQLSSDTVSVHEIIKVGNPLKKIVEAANEIDASLIIMGTVGGSGLQDIVGSNANHVIDHSPCPVLSIRKKPADPSLSRILLPLDMTLETKEKVAWGITFAKMYDSELIVFSSIPPNDEAYRAKIKKRMAVSIAHIKKNGVEKVNFALVTTKEGPGKAVMKYAETKGVGLICIMAQQEESIKEQLLGKANDFIVNHSDIPIMSINPSLEYGGTQYSHAFFS